MPDASEDLQPEDSEELEKEEGDMPWEVAAREAVQNAVADMEHDEIRGAIYLMSGHDHRWNRIEEEFRDAESIRSRLTELAEEEWGNYAPFDGGEPVFEPDVEDLVDDALRENEVEEFFSRVADPEDGEEIETADALLVPGAGLILEIDIQEINDELVRHLARHPEKMRTMDPRKFEILVAELFKDKGYEVEVTPRSKDGGLDIRVAQKSELGTFLILVECKRYAEDNPVGVEIVRGLYGVVSAENATAGLIATTSYFTKGAKSFQRQLSTRLKLNDFEELKRMLSAYKGRR